MTKINLSDLSLDGLSFDVKGEKVTDTRPGFFDTKAHSSASYRAFKLHGTDTYVIGRCLPEHETLSLGKTEGRERAERMIDWWVRNDDRATAAIAEKSHETVTDLMIECAMANPKDHVKPVWMCTRCHSQLGKLFEFSHAKGSVFLHLNHCLPTYMLETRHRGMLTGEFKENE